jgi:hypothetical protein
MKLGRYEYGFLLIVIAFLAISPFLRILTNIPKWISVTFFTIVFFGSLQLYTNWFLRHLCGNQLNRWINQHGFTYTVGGFINSTAHIQGKYHNRFVVIELWHGGRGQTSCIKCEVENPNRTSFTLSRRGFQGLSTQKGNSLFDPYFDDTFRVKPTSIKSFTDASLTDQLVEIQETTNVIDAITLDKNQLFLYYRGLITKGEMLDGALEAISLIANSLQ